MLVLEEVGKAVWVREAFGSAWYGLDKVNSKIPELHSRWRAHGAKLMAATDYHTALIEIPGATEPVDIELVRARSPEFVLAYLKEVVRADNQAKQQGFYVDLKDDGTFTVPHEIDRPFLRGEVWRAADAIKWSLEDDQLMCSIAGRPRVLSDAIDKRLAPILAHDPDEMDRI